MVRDHATHAAHRAWFGCGRGRWLLLIWALAAGISPAPASQAAAPGNPPAASDADTVHVVLSFSDEPLFTRLYKEAVLGQARDQLMVLLQGLFPVEVLTEHVLLERLADQPLENLNVSPLEAAELKLPGQVFLIRVEYSDGAYRVLSRRYDGRRGLLGPCRITHTPDRQWVPKAVCDAVRRELTLQAEVRPKRGKPDEVYLRFAASLSRETIERWLTPDTIFQVLRVEHHPDGSRRQSPVPNTVLILQPPPPTPTHKGERPFTARVVSNLRDPWRSGNPKVRYVAVNLPVQQGRLRLRFVDQASGEPAYGATIQVRVSDRGFNAMTDQNLLELNREGYVTTPLLARLAYVQVLQAGEVAFEFPIPIVQEWAELEWRIPIDEQGREKAAFERLLSYQARELQLLHEQLNAAIRSLNAMNDAKRYEEARDASDKLLRDTRSSANVANRRLNELLSMAQSLGLQQRPRLRQAADETERLNRRLDDLARLHESLVRTIAKAEAQARADVLIELGNQALDAYEIEDAIIKYTLALAEQPDQPNLKKRLEELQEAWRVKGSAHKAARELIFGRWAQAEITELQRLLTQVRQAAQTLQRFNDHLGLGKLVAANSDHIAALSELVDELVARSTTEDQQEADKWVKFMNTLETFNEELIACLESLENSTSPAPPTSMPAAGGGPPPPARQDDAPTDSPTETSDPPPAGSSPSPPPLDEEEE